MTQAEPGIALLVEGWRGINHSFALVSQYQILEMLEIPGLRLFHRDLPFAFQHWNRTANPSGFTPRQTAAIDGLPDPGATPLDGVFRVSSPFRAPADDDRRRTITFMITEFGLTQSSFEAGSAGSPGFTRHANRIVTSSRWSFDRIVQAGFDPGKISVLPLGVDQREFYPLGEAERRTARAALGLAEHDTVFLNVGAALWNKGIDLLLAAFAEIRRECLHKGANVRLLLKDQREVYGIPLEQAIAGVAPSCPEILDPDVMAGITLIPGNVSRAQLRMFYGLADAYVSPYRAEGFNLPVLEAIACATPVIVTAGGATDDFCADGLGIRIPGAFCDRSETGPGCFIEPDPQALLAAMRRFAEGERPEPAAFARARDCTLAQFTWKRAAVGLIELVRNHAAAPVAWTPPAPIGQSQILELIAMLRPRVMRGGKTRIGGAHDGGYVTPARALECDGVLSIGVGGDVSFDLALAERGALVMQFDHTVASLPADHPNFTFHRLGWGTCSERDLLDFTDIHARFAQSETARRLLKFDIEGCEYQVLPATDPALLREYEMIVCEIHDLSRLLEPEFYRQARNAIEILTRGHAPVHLHANNYRGTAILAGVPVPDVLEISLLRRDLDELADLSRDPIPGPLDQPNHPGFPDVIMTVW